MSKFTILNKESRYKGYISVDCMQVAIGDKRGSLEIIERGDSVALLIVDPNTHECIITRQFRPAISDIMDGPVAGMIDNGESEKSAMIRELLEETGIVLKENALIDVGRHFLSAGIMTEATTCFIAFMTTQDIKFPYNISNEHEFEFLQIDTVPLNKILSTNNKQASLSLCALLAEKEILKLQISK